MQTRSYTEKTERPCQSASALRTKRILKRRWWRGWLLTVWIWAPLQKVDQSSFNVISTIFTILTVTCFWKTITKNSNIHNINYRGLQNSSAFMYPPLTFPPFKYLRSISSSLFRMSLSFFVKSPIALSFNSLSKAISATLNFCHLAFIRWSYRLMPHIAHPAWRSHRFFPRHHHSPSLTSSIGNSLPPSSSTGLLS